MNEEEKLKFLIEFLNFHYKENPFRKDSSNEIDAKQFLNHNSEIDKTQPYIKNVEVNVILKYNKDYGDDRICKCGHQYYRHFDTYNNMEYCGCKYCGCAYFEEKK